MTSHDSSDFAALLEASEQPKRLQLQEGDRVRGRIIHISKDTAFVALDAKHEAMISLGELKSPEIGQVIEANVASCEDQIWLTTKGGKTPGPSGAIVEGKITAVNSGGVEVDVGGQKAFCPIGQLDLAYIEDPKTFLGRTLSFVVAQSTGKQMTLNRKILLQRERAEKTRELLSTLSVGDKVEVPATRVADFGVFVDLGGGFEGLIPQSEVGFGKISVGDRLVAQIMRIEPDTKRAGQMRVSLSLKAALPNPFETHAPELSAGSQITGTVARLESYGAFVSLFPGLDGLIHVSELSNKRIKHPDEVVKIGDQVTVRILDADPVNRRVSLTLKEPGSSSEQPAAPPAQKSSTKSLGTLGDLMRKANG
jgi:small subunit ribosomal protein S1